jgi:hypothetical protein
MHTAHHGVSRVAGLKAVCSDHRRRRYRIQSPRTPVCQRCHRQIASVSGADGKRVYAIVEAEDGGVFVSDDSGSAWKRSANRRLRQRAFYYLVSCRSESARHPLRSEYRFYKSTDGAKQRRYAFPTETITTCGSHPTIRARMINNNDSCNVSINGARPDRPGSIRRRSSITSPTRTSLITFAARNGTTRRFVTTEGGGRGEEPQA